MMDTYSNEVKTNLPNATLVLVLGVVSIIGCCCTYGALGVICGIVALVVAKTSTDLYAADPQRYTESSLKNINTGKVCAWIGLIPSILYLLVMIFLVATIGFAVLTDPNLLYEYFGVNPRF
jgi:hypothetical protein